MKVGVPTRSAHCGGVEWVLRQGQAHTHTQLQGVWVWCVMAVVMDGRQKEGEWVCRGGAMVVCGRWFHNLTQQTQSATHLAGF